MRRSRERFRAWHPHCSTALSVDSAKPGGRVKRSKPYYDERPAAVILDVVMPGHMDALEALAAFKKIDREVPIIVLSGQGRTTTVVQAMKLGASDFVSEPFDETDLAVLPTRSNSGSSVAKWRRSASSCSRGPNTTCFSGIASPWPRSAMPSVPALLPIDATGVTGAGNRQDQDRPAGIQFQGRDRRPSREPDRDSG